MFRRSRTLDDLEPRNRLTNIGWRFLWNTTVTTRQGGTNTVNKTVASAVCSMVPPCTDRVNFTNHVTTPVPKVNRWTQAPNLETVPASLSYSLTPENPETQRRETIGITNDSRMRAR